MLLNFAIIITPNLTVVKVGGALTEAVLLRFTLIKSLKILLKQQPKLLNLRCKPLT